MKFILEMSSGKKVPLVFTDGTNTIETESHRIMACGETEIYTITVEITDGKALDMLLLLSRAHDLRVYRPSNYPAFWPESLKLTVIEIDDDSDLGRKNVTIIQND